MNTQQFEKQLKEWFTNWQKTFEEMQVQFNLGKMDAAEAFETNKNKLKEMVLQFKHQLETSVDSAEAYTQKLKAMFDDLLVQLSLGKAETKEAFLEQKKKIEDALNQIYNESKQIYNRNMTYALNMFDNNAQAFKAGIEMMQLQYTLMKMDARDEADEARKKLNEKMNEFFVYADKAKDLTIENIEEFNKSLRENYNKMNSWLSDWLNKPNT
ncbi:MAG: hypothetical protein ACK4K9_00940 [Bacteroidia bacterium]